MKQDHIDPSQTKIFVTGGTGFLGSYLLRYLVAMGFQQIIALKRPDSPLDLVSTIHENIQWVNGDILDQPYLEDIIGTCDYLFHCAGKVSFNPKDQQEMNRVNVLGTTHIVNAALHTQAKKLVHVSSIAAIGRPKKTPHITEGTKWERSALNTFYGITKYQAEREVWRGMAEGLPVAVVNPSIILGSGFWHGGTQQLFKMAFEGFPFYGNGLGAFVDVRDVARFMIQLLSNDYQGERYIVNAINLSYLELMSQIANHFSQKPPRFKATPFISAIAWRLEALKSIISGREPTITQETARQANARFHFSNEKTLAHGFEYLSFEETLKETCAQYLQAKNHAKHFDILPLKAIPQLPLHQQVH